MVIGSESRVYSGRCRIARRGLASDRKSLIIGENIRSDPDQETRFQNGCVLRAATQSRGYNRRISTRWLLQIENFDQGDAGRIVLTAHDCSVGARGEGSDDGRFCVIGWGQPTGLQESFL